MTNLKPDTSYIFVVRAENSHGLSHPSPTSQVKMMMIMMMMMVIMMMLQHVKTLRSQHLDEYVNVEDARDSLLTKVLIYTISIISTISTLSISAADRDSGAGADLLHGGAAHLEVHCGHEVHGGVLHQVSVYSLHLQQLGVIFKQNLSAQDINHLKYVRQT